MTQKDTIERAYGSIPKEVTAIWFDNFFECRGIKYYWYKLIRKVTR